MGSRNVLQGYQATTIHQISYRDQRKCGNDRALGRHDYNPDAQRAKRNGETQGAFIKLSCFYPIEHIRQN